MSERIALITGADGQDGHYLTRWLLDQGYVVHAVRRGRPALDTVSARGDARDAECVVRHAGDLLDPIGLRRVLWRARPAEVYNLAAQSHVHASFVEPIHTAQVVALGALNLLDAVRDYIDATGRAVRFYQASSSEMFGDARESPQNEETPFRPRNPYACAKAHAFWQTATYRDAYALFACNGILYNHESPRRSEAYVTRKITRAAARIRLGLQHELRLGNVEAQRDWGFAGDYVRAMWLMLQQPEPDDYVIATGRTHSVGEFLDTAFGLVGLEWRDYVCFDERYVRPTEPRRLVGDAGKARRVLGWEPTVSFEELVRMMVEADLAGAERERAQVEAGHTV